MRRINHLKTYAIAGCIDGADGAGRNKAEDEGRHSALAEDSWPARSPGHVNYGRDPGRDLHRPPSEARIGRQDRGSKAQGQEGRANKWAEVQLHGQMAPRQRPKTSATRMRFRENPCGIKPLTTGILGAHIIGPMAGDPVIRTRILGVRDGHLRRRRPRTWTRDLVTPRRPFARTIYTRSRCAKRPRPLACGERADPTA